MSGPAPSKKLMTGVKVYVHAKDRRTNSRIIHIDIESPELNKIIKNGESTYCAGKKGGIFLGLKKEMIPRAERFVKRKK
jgi:hypothetical protein